MILTITPDDIKIAHDRSSTSANGREHTAHHPIAIALKRVLGPAAEVLVTKRWIHISNLSTDMNRMIPVRGEIRGFQEAWIDKKASQAALPIFGL